MVDAKQATRNRWKQTYSTAKHYLLRPVVYVKHAHLNPKLCSKPVCQKLVQVWGAKIPSGNKVKISRSRIHASLTASTLDLDLLTLENITGPSPRSSLKSRCLQKFLMGTDMGVLSGNGRYSKESPCPIQKRVDTPNMSHSRIASSPECNLKATRIELYEQHLHCSPKALLMNGTAHASPANAQIARRRAD